MHGSIRFSQRTPPPGRTNPGKICCMLVYFSVANLPRGGSFSSTRRSTAVRFKSHGWDKTDAHSPSKQSCLICETTKRELLQYAHRHCPSGCRVDQHSPIELEACSTPCFGSTFRQECELYQVVGAVRTKIA